MSQHKSLFDGLRPLIFTSTFDVKALYPSIPVKKALEVVRQKLEADETLKDRTKWTPKEIIDLLEICLETHFKTIGGRIFTQINGTPIGKSISGPIAGIYMNWFEEEFIYSDQCKQKPSLWKRMRDDVLIIWEHGEESLDEMLGYLNIHEKRIQFTIEKEKDGVLPFLDLEIHRKENEIKTKVYRKDTHTFRYLHWRSNHPKNCLLGVMKGLIYRAYRLCDEEKDLMDELGFLKDIFISNGYPVGKVEKIFKEYVPNLDKAEQDEDTNELLSLFIPFVPQFSENFRRIMKKEGIDVIFTKSHTLQNELCHLKPLRGRLERKDVVYMVDCKLCQKSYIGETAQKFSDRAAQHKGCIRNKKRKNGFFMHIKQALGRKHKNKGTEAMFWDGVSYLDSERNWRRRKIKESIYINAYDASLEVKDLMNLEKGCKIDACWNEFNDFIKNEAEKRRSAQAKKLGIQRPTPKQRRRSPRLNNV